jgi:hypothetical protein
MCSCSGSCNCNSTTIPRGPAGPQGPQGIQGITGTNGVTPTITVGNVTTVPFGDPATVTDVGTPPNAIFDFEIPEGEQGVQGDPGPVSLERILNDQSAVGAGTSTAVNITFTQLTENGQTITLDFQNSPADYADTMNSAFIQLITSTGPELIFSVSKDISTQGLREAKIKYDIDPTTGPPSGYPSTEQPNVVKGSLKIERVTSTFLKVYGTIYAYCIQSDSFGDCFYVQKSWIINSSYPVTSSSSFQISFSTAADFEPSVQVTQILKYYTPYI